MKLSRTCYACGKSVLAKHRVIARGIGNGEGLRVLCSKCHQAGSKEPDARALPVWADPFPAKMVWSAPSPRGLKMRG
jgi:ribosomal protein S27AE